MKNTKQYRAPVALVIAKVAQDVIRTSEFEFPKIPIDCEEEETT